MKLIFVDSLSNRTDPYGPLSQYIEGNMPDVEFARISAPEAIKLPVAVKKAFNEGAEAVIAFVTASGDESRTLDLMYERIMQVELEAVRYAFVVVVFHDEYRSQEQLDEAAAAKLAEAIDEINRTMRGGTRRAVAEETPEQTMPDVGIATPGEGGTSEAQSTPDVHSLF